MITLDLQRKQAGTTTLLQAMRIDIDERQVVALQGPSGAGKSTLLAILSTLDPNYEGRLTLLGQRFDRTSEGKRAAFRGKHVGFVFQVPRLLAGFDALANLQVADTMAGRTHDAAWAKQLLQRVGLEKAAAQRVDTLSGGERQRLTLARALLGRPKLLFADEPTGNLDPASARLVLDLMLESVEALGLTCVIATHDAQVIGRAARVIALNKGALQ